MMSNTIKVSGPNRGVKGKIFDEDRKPLEGLVVVVEDMAGNCSSKFKIFKQ